MIVLAGGTNAIVSVSAPLAERGLDAPRIQAALSGEFGGGGGGRSTLARAGGGNPDRVGAALDAARAAIETR